MSKFPSSDHIVSCAGLSPGRRESAGKKRPLPVIRWALEEAHRHGVRAILNPAPVSELPDDLLGLVAYLTPNEAEAAGLAAGGTQEEVVPLAGAAAALTCTRRGAQDPLPERAEVERFLSALRAGEGA